MRTLSLPVLLLPIAALLVPSLAGAQVVSYEVIAPSGYAQGCFPPCLCPIMFTDGVTGGFTSTYSGTIASVQTYQITALELLLLGNSDPHTGTGAWSRDELTSLQRFQATITAPGGATQDFDSGWMPWTPTPAGSADPLDVAIAVNGFFCMDTAFYLTAVPVDPNFLRGDCNADGAREISDAVELLDGLFAPGGSVACVDACDANDDGLFNIADAIALLGHLFSGAGPLPAPFDGCGPDPTADSLGCVSFPPCS